MSKMTAIVQSMVYPIFAVQNNSHLLSLPDAFVERKWLVAGTRSRVIRRGASMKVGSPIDADSMTVLFVQLVCIRGSALLDALRRIARERVPTVATRVAPFGPVYAELEPPLATNY